jgi:hypothetical protein
MLKIKALSGAVGIEPNPDRALSTFTPNRYISCSATLRKKMTKRRKRSNFSEINI